MFHLQYQSPNQRCASHVLTLNYLHDLVHLHLIQRTENTICKHAQKEDRLLQACQGRAIMTQSCACQRFAAAFSCRNVDDFHLVQVADKIALKVLQSRVASELYSPVYAPRLSDDSLTADCGCFLIDCKWLQHAEISSTLTYIFVHSSHCHFS